MSTAAWILRHTDQFNGFTTNEMDSFARSPVADGISKGMHLPHQFSTDPGTPATDPLTIQMLVPVRLYKRLVAQGHID